MKQVGTNAFLMLPLLSLASREVVRFFRQRSRVIGAIGTPLLFWFLLGSGIGTSYQSSVLPGMGYLEYFFPGTFALVLLMTSVFSTISVIQDRSGGFLQSVLVAPASGISLVGGKAMGGVLVALSQALLMVCLLPLIGLPISMKALSLVCCATIVFAFSSGTFAFWFAWRINSVQGFHGIMNLMLFPMWLLSGAVFPMVQAPEWLRYVMKLNPVLYGVSAIRAALYGGKSPLSLEEPSFWLSLLVLVSFGIVFLFFSVSQVAKRRNK